MDSNADPAILQWIETLPDTPIASLTMGRSSSGIQTRSKGKRPPQSPTPSSSRKSRKANPAQNLKEPSTNVTTPDPALPNPEAPSVTFQAPAPEPPSEGQLTPRPRSNGSGRNSKTNTPDKNNKPRDRDSRTDFFWLKRAIPKTIFVNFLEEDAKLDLPSGHAAQKLDSSTLRAVENLVRKLEEAAARQRYDGGAIVDTIVQRADQLRYKRLDEPAWYDVTQQVLAGAIGDRPLESRSVLTAALTKDFLPIWVDEYGKTTGLCIDRKIDYVVFFPQDKHEHLYETTLQSFIGVNSPFRRDPHSENLVGLGLEVKEQSGSHNDAEAQIGIWCTAYFQWLRIGRTTKAFLPPIVACTMVGVHFDFFVAYTIEDPDYQSFQVMIWGARPGMRGSLDTREGVIRVLNTLGAYFDYLTGDFMDSIRGLCS